jgi:ferredoxin--NADP+ reductase
VTDGSTRPLRVAVVGSGPSGFYAVEHLQKQVPALEVDLFDRLPTPYGLVRGGVAPDHPKIKSVTRIYEKIAAHPSFRFLGHVHVGRDLTHEELAAQYDAVIYAVGAQTDRALGVPGESLPGSHAATEFVAWYNGHPDYRDLQFDLSQEAVAVIGLGNVAMDVTRILASTPDELAGTDIADHALAALRDSRVRTIYVLGRRGPAQAAFTNPEIRELGELAEADCVVDPAELVLDPASEAWLAQTDDRTPPKNLETLRGYAARGAAGKPRRIVLRFCVSPEALEGTDRVTAIRVGRNRLVPSGDDVKAEPTGETETLPVGLVFRSVGYRGVAIPGVPFDEKRGTVPNAQGRVLTAAGASETVPGTYVTGWIKRGPSGIIGTNKPDSVETVEALLADRAAGTLPAASGEGRAAIDRLLAARGTEVVTFDGWRRIDAVETSAGRAQGRPRVKLTRVAELLAAARGA